MGLVGLAHASSHFFHLVLPPLFPILKQEFDVSYAQLGLLPGLFFAASGVMQIISGFLVDQFGARRVLLAGLVLLSISMLLCGLVSEFWMLIPLAVVGGIGNSVFHPADLAILTDKISRPRLGRAYGIHALSGNIGWAAAPVFIMTVVQFSDWRTALVLAGCVGFAVLLVLYDAVLAAATWVAYGLRFDFDVPQEHQRHIKGIWIWVPIPKLIK